MTTPQQTALRPPRAERSRSGDLTVRLSTVSDWAWLRRVMPAVFPEIEPAYLRHMLCNLRHRIAVAVDEAGQRVGFCQFHRSADGCVLWVNFIGVDPTVRRGGIGKALLDWTEDHASRLGCERIELDVVTSNHGAIAFYDRLAYLRAHTLMDDMNRSKFRYVKAVTPQVPPTATTDLIPSRPARIVWRLLYVFRFLFDR